MSDTPDSVVRTYIRTHHTALPDDRADWLRVPSVSAQTDHDADVRRGADGLAGKLTETGFPGTEIRDTPGAPAAPVVYAEWPSTEPDAPTVPVHGHHDVQPASRADGPGGWTISPASARLKLSFRLVAGQDPAQDPDRIECAVRDWTDARVPAGIRHKITFGGAARPCPAPLDHPALQSPDEKAEPDLLLKGIETTAYLWGDLATALR